MTALCGTTRRLLSDHEHPAALGPEGEAHLAGCAACRRFLDAMTRRRRVAAALPQDPGRRRSGAILGRLRPALR